MRSLLAAFRFLTRLPLPGRPTERDELQGAVVWFPVVGACVGLFTAAAFHYASRIWPPTVAAALSVAAGLLLTGGFHEDGLSDAVDGLGGGFTREKILAIMKDSRIGAYGSMALVCALLLRFALLVSLGDRALLVFPLAMALGRWSIVHVLALLPPIAEGLAKEVHRKGTLGLWLGSTGLTCLLAGLGMYFGLPRVPLALLASLLASLVWAWRLQIRLGGHSGDCLGATAMLGEAAALLVWVAR
ncbi:MAG TPA: adenosylcobinamide-GDP ribazoletransferase [Pseudomonadota bacterium]|nr:adenosylcobinamide-GDP ribazoletransferase [Pseudomonadota bacterium]